jgi:hypothetical protein
MRYRSYSRYSFFTSVGIVLACTQIILLIVCCGCLKAEECLRVRSYTIDLLWAIAKEVPQILIIFHINLCRDGWFKMSSLFKAIFSIFITIWKLNNLLTFLRTDVKSDVIPNWCRAKRLYMCFPIFLIPVWIVNLALSLMIAILFVHRHHGSGHVSIPGSIHSLYVHDKYLYTKYIVRSGIYLRWPETNYTQSYMKLADIDYIMANRKASVQLLFQLPYVCYERSLQDRRVNQCFKFDSQTNTLTRQLTKDFDVVHWQNISFTFRYRAASNQYNLGQITYQGHVTSGSLYFDRLLYFRLHDWHRHHNDDDFLHRSTTAMHDYYQFYHVNQELIPIEKAWRYGLGKCRPCILGPQLTIN